MTRRARCAVITIAAITLIAAFNRERKNVAMSLRPGPGPAFEIEIVKPRLSRPLFGVLPNVVEVVVGGGNPWLNHESAGVEIGAVAHDRFEVRAERWDVRIHAHGAIERTTSVTFPIRLGGSDLTLRCRPAEPPVGSFEAIAAGPATLRGRFRIELAQCENALSGKAIEWPPVPLTMVGAFEQLASPIH